MGWRFFARPARGTLTQPVQGVYITDSVTRQLQCVLGFAAFAMLLPCTGAFGASDPNQGWIEVRSPHFVVVSNAGEKEARPIADQFEQIRALFHTAFPNLRVDPSEPVLILAAKKENTMKMLRC
jgi:hypothetical protein